jgi:hypothetical protein
MGAAACGFKKPAIDPSRVKGRSGGRSWAPSGGPDGNEKTNYQKKNIQNIIRTSGFEEFASSMVRVVLKIVAVKKLTTIDNI